MSSEGTTPVDSAGAQSHTERKGDDEGLLDKAKEKLTGSDEEETPEERSAQQQHRSEEAPPPGEEPTSTGHDSPKTGPA
jgi:hypothetical protein